LALDVVGGCPQELVGILVELLPRPILPINASSRVCIRVQKRLLEIRISVSHLTLAAPPHPGTRARTGPP